MASSIPTATRMALLATKKKIRLASKGHKLLKEKRDALIAEFFKLIDKLKVLRQEMETELAEAYRNLFLAQAVSGVAEVRRAAAVTKALPALDVRHKVVMGIKVPLFAFEVRSSRADERGYSLVSSSLELDAAARRFEAVMSRLITIAEQEAAVKLLADEIKKTKRKVNALERILIPRLDAQKAYISMRLEEMDRETFGRLKIIKAKIMRE